MEGYLGFLIFAIPIWLAVTLKTILPTLLMRHECKKAPIVKAKVIEPEIIKVGEWIDDMRISRRNAYRTRLQLEDGTIVSRYYDFAQLQFVKVGSEVEIKYFTSDTWCYKKLRYENRFMESMFMLLFLFGIVSVSLIMYLITGK